MKKADRRVVECLGHFHRTRSQAFACAKITSLPKKQRQTFLTIAELSAFFKRQHELKTLNAMFFESAFEDLSFCSFLKASD